MQRSSITVCICRWNEMGFSDCSVHPQHCFIWGVTNDEAAQSSNARNGGVSFSGEWLNFSVVISSAVTESGTRCGLSRMGINWIKNVSVSQLIGALQEKIPHKAGLAVRVTWWDTSISTRQNKAPGSKTHQGHWAEWANLWSGKRGR